MTNDEIQLKRETAVFDVLTDNEGAVLVYEEDHRAFIRLEGMSSHQKRAHLVMCCLTLGLWVPAFAIISFICRPRILVIHVTGDGKVLRYYA